LNDRTGFLKEVKRLRLRNINNLLILEICFNNIFIRTNYYTSMELTSILLNEYASVETNLENKYIQVTWLTQPKSEAFRETHKKALQNALQHELIVWLCDMREMLYLEVADQNWLVREIFTSFDPSFNHGVAFVVSTAGLELMTSLRILEMVKNSPELHKQLKVEIFFQKSIAQQWLFEAK